MYENCLLNLVVTPEVEDTVVDWLLEQESINGFSSASIAGHGSSEHAMSLAEQVAGRRRQVLFQVHLTCEQAQQVLSAIRQEFTGSGMHFWLVPVMEAGHLA